MVVPSGLVVDASDEEDDFFSSLTSPSPSIKLNKNAGRRSISSTPVVKRRSRSTSSSSLNRRIASRTVIDDDDVVQAEEEERSVGEIKGRGLREEPFTTTTAAVDEDEDVIEEGRTTMKKSTDTRANCGDLGYRCTKPFCFKCI